MLNVTNILIGNMYKNRNVVLKVFSAIILLVIIFVIIAY